MQQIKSTSDLLIVPTSYFEGMERRLQKFVDMIEIHDMDAMEQLLCLRDWMKPLQVDKEVRKMFPNIQWNNIHQLLPDCTHQCSLVAQKGD